MLKMALNHAARRAAAQHNHGGGLLDVRFGWSLFKDKRVPMRAKLLALGLGVAGLFLIEILELPVQTLMWTLLPVIGFGLDLAIDGVEFFVWPMLIATLLLPHLAPKSIVETVRVERYGLPNTAAK